MMKNIFCSIVCVIGMLSLAGNAFANIPNGGTPTLGTLVNDAGANIQVNVGGVLGVVSSAINIALNGGTFVSAGSCDNIPISVLGAGGVEQNANHYRMLINWTRLMTNQFDAAGNFLFTNPIHTDKQQFYRLQIP